MVDWAGLPSNLKRVAERRRMLFYPRGNKPSTGYSSAYLDAPEAQYFPTPRVSFSLSLVNQLDSSQVVIKGETPRQTFRRAWP